MIFSCGNNLDKEITTEMLNDGYTGQGTYTWTDGKNYVEEFKNDGPWNGTIYDKDGRKLLKFVNGERIEQSPSHR